MNITHILAQAEATAPAAQPAGQAAGPMGTLMSLLPFILLMVGFWFLMIVPQRKQKKEHEKMLSGLKNGDHVLTIGGICGTVTLVKADRVRVKIDDSTHVDVLKSAIQGLDKSAS